MNNCEKMWFGSPIIGQIAKERIDYYSYNNGGYKNCEIFMFLDVVFDDPEYPIVIAINSSGKIITKSIAGFQFKTEGK